MRISIWQPGLHCANIAVKTSSALQIVFSMVSQWCCWCSTRVFLCFIRSQRTFMVNNFVSQKQSSIGVLSKSCSWKFHKITGKHLCQSLFFDKVAVLQHYLKRDSGTGAFLWIFWIFKNTFFYRIPQVAAFEKKKLLTLKVVNQLEVLYQNYQ